LDDEDEEVEEEQLNVVQVPFYIRIFRTIRLNYFSCEWLDKIEINRELGESQEIGLMEGR